MCLVVSDSMRLALAALLLASSVAHAQPGESPVIAPAQPAKAPKLEGDRKDPSIAALLSLGLPVAGAITMAAADNEGVAWLGFGALYLGPSTGRWYAGEAGLGTLGLRTVGGLSTVVGFAMVLGSEFECEHDYEYDASCNDARDRADRRGIVGGALMLGGAGLWVGTTIADIVYAKRAADKWNERRGFVVAPGLVGPNRSPGMFVSGSF